MSVFCSSRTARIGYHLIGGHNSWSTDVATAKILLIDDDVELLDMLEAYLRREELVVTVTDVAATGMAAALSGEHDLVVLDVMMPHVSGVEVLRQIRMSSLLPVLMLTAKGEDADCIVGLELGADDYVSKPCTPRELAARIRAILRRTRAVEVEEVPAVIASGLLRVFPRQRRAEWAGKPLNLTSAELNLLEALARHVHVVGEYDVLRREVQLTIADEGPGVESAELASIFEPFFRGAAARGTPGHGLGLAITHRVIQSHGGRISASNRTSGGLAVEIHLPA